MLSEEEMAEYEESNNNRFVPPEVVFEILKRLPAKSLNRFKCVAILWHAIISDRGFASSHWLHRRSRPTVLITLPHRGNFATQGPKSKDICLHLHAHHGDGAAGTDSLPRVLTDLEQAPHFKVHTGGQYIMPMYVSPSVGGLVCLEHRDRMKICNPSTGQHVMYPSIRAEVQHPEDYTTQWTSLCFDPVTNQHKVLQSIMNSRLSVVEHHAMTFSMGELGDRRWRRIGKDGALYTARMDRDAVCLNGVLYYTVLASGQIRLMQFHVQEERFQLGSGNLHIYTAQTDLHKYQTKLVEYSNGRLAIVDIPWFKLKGRNPHSRSSCVRSINLRVLDRSGATCRMQSIALPPEEMLPRASYLSVLGSIHAGEVLVFMSNVDNLEYSCLFYDAKINSFTKRVQMHTPMFPGHSAYCPMFPGHTAYCPIFSVSDHEENLMALEN